MATIRRAYLRRKRSEVDLVRELEPVELVERYDAAY
jgi:hypothetical protein